MIHSLPLVSLLLMTSSLTTSSDTREHKVHNIVLYPERHSWCQTTAIKQIVAMPGYKPMTIDNNVCVGACYSYSIPRTQPAEPGELIGPYCDSCQPLETQCYHVTLKADGQTADSNSPKTIQKRVQIITNCSCSSCSKVQTSDCEISDQSTSELPTNLFSLLHPNHAKSRSDRPEVPELLNLAPPKNRTLPQPLNENATNEQRYEINAKLISLLKSIQNQEDDEDSFNLNYDKKQLKELLDIIEGSEHQLSDKNLMDFVNFVNVHNSEDLELDLSRLKEVLMSFRDDEDPEKKYSVPKTFGEGSRLGMGHLKGSHIGMGIHKQFEANLVGKDENKVGHHKGKVEDNVKIGHHHLGETQHVGLQVGHLTHGPHNSLVLVPDKVEEKLNLDSEEVRPNLEGVVVSYENHHRLHHRHKQPTN